ncbi:hypothetical protein BDW71DRAFT_183452 [Aspergillus fruticulosus]
MSRPVSLWVFIYNPTHLPGSIQQSSKPCRCQTPVLMNRESNPEPARDPALREAPSVPFRAVLIGRDMVHT